MLTSTPLSIFTVVMERMHDLEPRLQAFWEEFPCPPPWKEELLFRLNWTGCIGSEVGERVKLYMADKCNIRHDGLHVLPGDDVDGDDGVMIEDDCNLTCQLIIGVVCVLFLVLLFTIVVFCVRRKRAKAASPSHQSALTAHPDNAKYYTSCHYACAPVVPRQIQTSMNGDRTETIVVPAANNSSGPMYHPGSYPQHQCQQLGYHMPHLPPYPHQTPRMVNTPYGPVPAQTSSLVVPQSSRYYSAHYRKFDPAYSSSSCYSNSDRSPVYESIDDADSIRERNHHARDPSISECEFCECGHPHHATTAGGEQQHRHGSGYPAYQEVEHLPGDQQSDSDGYVDRLANLGFPPDIEPPCPPLYSDGYYGDRRSQTLPLRPMRNHHPIRNCNNASPPSEDVIGHDELVPLTPREKGGGSGAGDTIPLKHDGSTRRRPSSGSSGGGGGFSNNGSQYKEGTYDGQRRPIPALHRNYFVANQEEIS